MNKIKITIDEKIGKITVWNDGKGIPVVKDKEHNIYRPEIVLKGFVAGSSESPGKNESSWKKLREVGSIVIETNDSSNGKIFKHVFPDDEDDSSDPEIRDCEPNSPDSTQVEFIPNLRRFGMEELGDDMLDLMVTRIYSLAKVMNEKIQVQLNEDILKEVKASTSRSIPPHHKEDLSHSLPNVPTEDSPSSVVKVPKFSQRKRDLKGQTKSPNFQSSTPEDPYERAPVRDLLDWYYLSDEEKEMNRRSTPLRTEVTKGKYGRASFDLRPDGDHLNIDLGGCKLEEMHLIPSSSYTKFVAQVTENHPDDSSVSFFSNTNLG